MITFSDARATLAMLLAALLMVSAPAFADDVEDAARLLKSGQHQQALDRVNKVLAAKPKDARARFLKGLIFAEQGNTKDATEIFLALTKDFPNLPEPYNNLAVIYAAQGQYEKARGALEQSIRTHPSYATAYENLGDVYAKLASQAYDKALQFDSANPAAKNKLALVKELVGGSAPGSKPVVIAAAPAAPAPPAAPVAQTETAKEPAKAATVVAAAEPAKQAAPKEAPKAPAAAPEPIKPAPASKEPAKAPVVAAVEPAKPAAEKPAAPKPGNAEILDAVHAWAKAWSAKDVDHYLAAYAKDFKTPGGESRTDWESARRQRISAPKSIAVTVDAPKVTVAADGHATVTFRQGYRSDVVKAANTTKTLVLAKTDGRWLIQQERVGN